jgi:hypothetical protein
MKINYFLVDNNLNNVYSKKVIIQKYEGGTFMILIKKMLCTNLRASTLANR